MRVRIAITLLAALSPCAIAQRSVSPGGPAHFSGHPTGFAPHHASHNFGGAVFYPLALGDPFYGDYLSATGSPTAYPPPVFVMQTPPPVAAPEPPPPVSPLLIELQGDRYVQVSGDKATSSSTIERAPLSATPSNSPAVVAKLQRSDLTALLIFRDGHREEISGYTIAGGTLYAGTDYYSAGSWNRNIELSSLDIAETVRWNQSRGLQFRLPGAPNEVIVGP